MPVALLPPYTSSPGRPDATPLTECARYVRGPQMSRWHRVRSAYRRADGSCLYAFWCGPAAHGGAKQGTALLVDEVPDGEKACGTCVGRALGAGQDDVPAGMPAVRFDPRWSTPPALCPGSGSAVLWADTPQPSQNVVVCLACGDLVHGRASGGPYRSTWGPVKHAPGEHLVEPCVWHAWSQITRVGDAAACSCGWVAS